MNARVLVIDDEEGVGDAFQLALDGTGHEVEWASNGRAGLDSASDQRPDLIFLDLKMPEMDGIETLRRLLGSDDSLKICILTAFHEQFMKDLKMASDDGLQFELARKPLDSTQIRTIVSGLLGGEVMVSLEGG